MLHDPFDFLLTPRGGKMLANGIGMAIVGLPVLAKRAAKRAAPLGFPT